MTTYPEHHLAKAMWNYILPGGGTYDPKFRQALETLVGPIQRGDAGPRKQEILDFIQQHECQPARSSLDPAERRLSWSLTAYTSPSHRCYDPEFCERIGWIRRVDRIAARKAEIIAWIEQHGRLPQPRQPGEKGLRAARDKYVKIDPQFAAEVERLCPLDTRKSHRRGACQQ